MSNLAEISRELEFVLDEECRLYLRYNALVEEERKHIGKVNPDKILSVSAERERVYELMKAAQERRGQLVKTIAGSSRMRLSEFIERYYSGAPAANLKSKVEKLRSLVQQTASRNSEFSQVVNFALKMAGGLITILWSATQNVVRSYTASGRMKESYHTSSLNPGGRTRQI